jgi:hypothetical protein
MPPNEAGIFGTKSIRAMKGKGLGDLPLPRRERFLERSIRWLTAFALAPLMAAPTSAQLPLAQHGDAVAGKKIASIVKDDTGAAELARLPRIEVGMTMRSRRTC